MNKKLSGLTQEQSDLVWTLRVETGNGVMDCKRALKESNWDLDSAKEYLIKFFKSGRILIHETPITDEDLMSLYYRGFNDELKLTEKPKEYLTPIEKRAYFLGRTHALLGDDQPSLDYLSREEILNKIKQ